MLNTAKANQKMRTKSFRTVGGYTYDFRKRQAEPERELPAEWECTTWGCDYEGIIIPATRPEAIRRKCQLQMTKRRPVDEIELRYLLECIA